MVASVVGGPQDRGGGVRVVEVVSDHPDVGVVFGSRSEMGRDGEGGENASDLVTAGVVVDGLVVGVEVAVIAVKVPGRTLGEPCDSIGVVTCPVGDSAGDVEAAGFSEHDGFLGRERRLVGGDFDRWWQYSGGIVEVVEGGLGAGCDGEQHAGLFA